MAHDIHLSTRDLDHFRKDGYLVVENLLPTDRIDALRASFPRVFSGDFDTGIYPDEWYWRPGMSLPDVTRHMANAWKSDLTIAKLVLSPMIAELAARLAGWPGIRLGQDTLWWKPPGTKAVTMHQDTSFMDFLDPPRTITCWVPLDDTHRDAGTLEYAAGSHRWPLTPIPDGFHAPDDYQAHMRLAANAAGIADPATRPVEVAAGSVVFHLGETWHGSGPNRTGDVMRRAIGIHMIHPDTVFSDRPGGYIYRRYQRTGDPALDESYFPVTWQADGSRTDWIEEYCRSGRRVSQAVA